MTTKDKIRIAVIGASGYTGADFVRLAVCHPQIEIVALAARTHAGKTVAEVFPHLGRISLPDLHEVDKVDWPACDAVICGLPHGTAYEVISGLPSHLKIIDMSADFRLRDPATYEKWYGQSHGAKDLLQSAVYGLTEHYADEIARAKLVACPGCYPTATLLALLPLVSSSVIDARDVVIDAKSGVSGAGRGLKQNTLFAEAGEGVSPYGVAGHRHAPEIEQELSKAAGEDVVVNFTPHLIPMSRGELVTCYVRMADGANVVALREVLTKAYADKSFVNVVSDGLVPATQHVRGSNYCLIGIFEDRIPGRAIVIATLDNLVKGSAGQAVQNFNLMFGFDETTGLQQQPLFP